MLMNDILGQHVVSKNMRQSARSMCRVNVYICATVNEEWSESTAGMKQYWVEDAVMYWKERELVSSMGQSFTG